MTFKWSPEAIDAAGWEETFELGRVGADVAEVVAAALVKVQPVAALPPCPTCEGSGRTWHNHPTYADGHCPTCNGSGVEQMIPASEIRDQVVAMREVPWTVGAQQAGTPVGYGFALDDLQRWLDEREARP